MAPGRRSSLGLEVKWSWAAGWQLLESLDDWVSGRGLLSLTTNNTMNLEFALAARKMDNRSRNEQITGPGSDLELDTSVQPPENTS